jgi:hypothetical protein
MRAAVAAAASVLLLRDTAFLLLKMILILILFLIHLFVCLSVCLVYGACYLFTVVAIRNNRITNTLPYLFRITFIYNNKNFSFKSRV